MTAMLLAKATVLLAAALAVAPLLRRGSAVGRHRLWSVVFAATLMLPVLAAALPPVRVPVLARWSDARLDRWPAVEHTANGPIARADRADASEPGTPVPEGSDSVAPVPSTARLDASTLLLMAWLAGATVALCALLLSLIRVQRLARSAESVDDPAWHAAAAAIGARIGLYRPAHLMMSPEVSTPMAGGLVRACIFLPASARTWTSERRDVVLAHEIAHLAARDPLRHLVTRLSLAVYWFHPLAWLAAREAAVAREQACDEAVLALGTRRSAYAQVLLDLAEAMQPAPAVAALPIVQRSLLENRLMAILDGSSRPATSRLVSMSVLGVAALTCSLAAMQPGSQPLPPASQEFAAVGGTSVAAVVAPARDASVAVGPSSALSTPPQGGALRDSACGWDRNGGSFRGSTSTSDVGGRTIVRERVGTRDNDHVIQKLFGDLQVCMVAEEVGGPDGRPSDWIGRARRVVIEARRGQMVRRMELGRQSAAGAPIGWQVGGVQRPLDDAAERWRDRMLAVLDTTWEISSLRGQVSSLHGEISSIHGERSSLEGEISSLRGEVSSMQGRISSIRGSESSLRGEISSIRGHLSSLRGAISSEQGAISSLGASRYDLSGADRARIDARTAQHTAAIKRLEQEIRDYDADARVAAVERRIAARDPDGHVAAVEKEIRAFDVERRVAEIERRITALAVEDKVAAIERQITTLDADRRIRQLEQRRDDELKRLEAALAAIK